MMKFGLSLIRMTLLGMTLVSVCESLIKWDINGGFLVFGKDAKLTCKGQSCPYKAIKKWIGGPNYNLLCFDNYSTDPNKYEMMSNETIPEFDLMIKRFNFSDADCEYTCSCGFLQYTNILKLKDLNFIYLPEILENLSEPKDETFQIDLSIMVHPKPACTYVYEDIALALNSTVIYEETMSGVNISHVRINATVDVTSINCKGNLTVRCNVGSLEHHLFNATIDLCKDGNPDTSPWIIIISVLISILVFAIVMICTVYKIVKMVTRKRLKPEHKVSKEMNENEGNSPLFIPPLQCANDSSPLNLTTDSSPLTET